MESFVIFAIFVSAVVIGEVHSQADSTSTQQAAQQAAAQQAAQQAAAQQVAQQAAAQQAAQQAIQDYATQQAVNYANGQRALQQAAQNLALTNRNVGQPDIRILHASGSGNDPGNFNGGYGAGVGMKVYESNDGRLSGGVSAVYSGGIRNDNFQLQFSQPSVGYGAGIRYNFHGKK